MNDHADHVHETLAQAIGTAVLDEPPDVSQGLAALAESPVPIHSDPLEEERLALRRKALAGPRLPDHNHATQSFCTLLTGLGVGQAYGAMVLRNGWLVLAAGATLMLARMAWHKSHWLQFNLRTALLLMVLVSLPLGWVGSFVRRYWREETALRRVEAEWSGACTRSYDHLPAWFQRRCPTDWLPVFAYVSQVVIYRGEFGDDEVPVLDSFQSLELLDLRHTNLTDAGVRQLAHHPHLASLYLSGTRVTRRGLRKLALFPSLAYVDAVDTAITRADAREFIADHPKIQVATRVDQGMHRPANPRELSDLVVPAEEFEGQFNEKLDREIKIRPTAEANRPEPFEIEVEPEVEVLK